MLRSLVLSALLTLTLPISTHVFGQAQEGDPIVVGPKSGMQENNCGYDVVDLVSDGLVYRVFVCGENFGKGTIQLEVTDAATGKRTMEKELHPKPSKGTKCAFENAAIIGGKLWVFVTTLDRVKGEGVFAIDACPMDPATGASDGTAVRIGQVPFSASGTGINDPRRIGIVVGASPNGKHVAVMFDRLVQEKGGNILFLWERDGDMNEVRSAKYVVSYGLVIDDPAKVIRAEVGNDGAVYAISNGTIYINMPDGASKRGTQVLRLTENGYTPVWEPEATKGGGESGCVLLPNGDLLVATVGIEYGKNVIGDEQATGIVIERKESDLTPIASSSWVPFEVPLNAMVMRMVIHVRADGGVYVVGNAKEGYGNQSGLFAASFGPSLKFEWAHTFPRDFRGVPVIYSGITKDGLEILVPELAKNAEAWKTGGKMKNTISRELPTVHITFDASGTPAITVDEAHMLMGRPEPRNESAPVQVCSCLATQGKRDEKGTCILHFK